MCCGIAVGVCTYVRTYVCTYRLCHSVHFACGVCVCLQVFVCHSCKYVCLCVGREANSGMHVCSPFISLRYLTLVGACRKGGHE